VRERCGQLGNFHSDILFKHSFLYIVVVSITWVKVKYSPLSRFGKTLQASQSCPPTVG
jgi:hypothetical protein